MYIFGYAYFVMYICAMNGPRKNKSNRSSVRIYHHILNLEYEQNASYFCITETRYGVIQTIYYYKIPDDYKNESPMGEICERYAKYCPN